MKKMKSVSASAKVPRKTTSVKRVKKPVVSKAQHHAAKRVIHRKRSPMKRIMMHPTMLFGMLVLGVLLIGLTFKVVADTITVDAAVQAPALTDGATFNSPRDGDILHDANVTVSGSCPADSYVKLYRNSIFAGVSLCNTNGLYSIQATLVVGFNTLQVQDFNSTDSPGPYTPTITVQYVPLPKSVDATNDQAGSTTAAGSVAPLPLMIWSDFHFVLFTTQDDFKVTTHIEGGVGPYRTTVEWGDGTPDSYYNVPDSKPFVISHRYKNAGYYPAIVTATDTDGRISKIQLAALIKIPGSIGTIGAILGAPSNPAPSHSFWQNNHWLVVVWPTYTMLTLMTLSFWLGERREYLQLIRKMVPRKPRAPRPRHA